MPDENQAPDAGAPATDPAVTEPAPSPPPDPAPATIETQPVVPPADPAAAPLVDTQAPAISQPDPAALTAPPADQPKRAAKKRAPAPTKPTGWYVTAPFRTQYNGVLLEFKADQLIEDDGMAQWLSDTGSPVDYLEG